MNVRNLHQRFVHQHAACHKEENCVGGLLQGYGGLCVEENQGALPTQQPCCLHLPLVSVATVSPGSARSQVQ